MPIHLEFVLLIQYLRSCAAYASTLGTGRNYPKQEPCNQINKITINKIKLQCAAFLELIN